MIVSEDNGPELHINVSDIEFMMMVYPELTNDEIISRCYKDEKRLYDKSIKNARACVGYCGIIDVLDKRVQTVSNIREYMSQLVSDDIVNVKRLTECVNDLEHNIKHIKNILDITI